MISISDTRARALTRSLALILVPGVYLSVDPSTAFGFTMGSYVYLAHVVEDVFAFHVLVFHENPVICAR